MFVCLTKIMKFSEGIEQSWTQEKMDALGLPEILVLIKTKKNTKSFSLSIFTMRIPDPILSFDPFPECILSERRLF